MSIYSRHIFPRLMNRAMSGDNFSRVRRSALAQVRGRTLEIGIGTGLNLSHYPESIRELTAVDVNPTMGRLARRRIEASGIEVDWRVADGERLPLDGGSFDSVVSTWTLCSIPDAGAALAEIRRVLGPAGAFHFVEHGLSDEERVARWQRRLTPLQRWIGDGCHLDRNIEQMILAAGFRFERLERFYMEGVPRIGGYLYRGVARVDAPATPDFG